MNQIVFALALLINVNAIEIKNGTTYDPGLLLSKIFNTNITAAPRQAGYGFIKFEDQNYPQDVHGNVGEHSIITFEDQGQNSDRPFFEEDPYKTQNLGINTQTYTGHVTFQNENTSGQEPGNKNQKKKRRRRKPKNGQLTNYPGFENSHNIIPGYSGLPQSGVGPNPYVNLGFQGGQFNRRPRLPRPSVASEALTALSAALTSIALYDDYQCVPRLLCEAAGGGALGSNGVLQSVASIQPLLTLLSVYNGISSSPLFVFGRAVFLGMTSKGNTGTCRYAYPQCPTDPEQLIHYLNNHNGGFFRFFNAPQLSNQHNVEQFYNQFAGQNYGLYQPNPGPEVNQQNYGFYSNDQNNFGYGQRPNLYGNQQSYGSNYAYDQNIGSNRIRFKMNKNDYDDIKINRIEKRIQNKPSPNSNDENFDYYDLKTKWSFPGDLNADFDETTNNIRVSKALKFPDEDIINVGDVNKDIRRDKSILFPEHHNNRHYYYTDSKLYQTSTPVNTDDYVFDYTHQFYVKKENYNQNNYDYNKYNYNKHNYKVNNEEGVKTIYVVRGNGDPNNPEIVKIRPGQTFY